MYLTDGIDIVMRRESLSQGSLRLLLATVAALCTACAQYQSYDLPLEGELASLGTEPEKITTKEGAALPEVWWQSLGDDNLSANIDAALNHNFSLAAVWERFQAAQALANKSSSALFPEFNLQGGVSQDTSEGNRSDNYSFGVAASYELDLWGKVRSASSAEKFRALASEQSYRTAALSLSANVAITWGQLVEANSQRNLILEQTRVNAKTLEILKARFNSGQIRQADILRQTLLNKALDDEKITVEADIQILNHQLSLLRGELPKTVAHSVSTQLPKLESASRQGISSQLIKRRPDVRAAQLELEAADKDLAAAVRDQYPGLSLSGSYLSNSVSAGSLFSSWISQLAASVSAPIFDGGLRRAEVSSREAVRNELVATYGQTVLLAIADVEDTLSREQEQKMHIENLQERVNIAKQVQTQVHSAYLNGVNSFLDLLGAQAEAQSLERDLLRARRNLFEIRISLHRALAGGFQTPRELKQDKEP